jgi:mannose-1-phosphate guanylyltransferase
MAGGASSRFFPLNKIFADLTGSGRSMLQQAFDRATAVREEAAPWQRFLSPARFHVVTGEALAPRIAAQLPELPAGNLVVEPEPRSTLPAILWAAAHLRRVDREAVAVVLTADHVIGELAEFRRQLGQALAEARESPSVVTLGIAPSADPAGWTGFGALRSGEALEGSGEGIHLLSGFEEKPSRERAEAMIREGGWSWNSGMFVFALATLERALELLQPGMARAYRVLGEALDSGDEEAARAAFRALPRSLPHPLQPECSVDNSVDYALMMPLVRERASGLRAAVLSGRFPWVDLGSWVALRQVVELDARGNVVLGEVSSREVRDSVLVAAEGRTLEAESLEGLVVVAAAEGRVLVVPAARAQEVKELSRRAAREPQAPAILVESEGCLVDPGECRVALLGVSGLHVDCRGDELRVRPFVPGEGGETLHDELARRALSLRPEVNHYAWGGTVLPALLEHPAEPERRPTAEAWLNSTRPEGPATLGHAALTLAELVAARPAVLGRWPRLLHGDGLPVFAKLLSTRFPPRVSLGFRRRVSREGLLGRLEREQSLLGELLGSLRLESEDSFRRFRRDYESWAVAASLAGWRPEAGPAGRSLARRLAEGLSPAPDAARLEGLLDGLGENRAGIVECLHEIDLEAEAGHLLLSPGGTVHGIFGMSIQVHPRDRAREALADLVEELRRMRASGTSRQGLVERVRESGLEALRTSNEGHPKDEAWLPFRAGSETLILEVQESSNETHSLADFFTPFAWGGDRPVFRKGEADTGLSRESLEGALRLVDLEPRDLEHYRRLPRSVAPPAGSRRARVEVLLDDPGSCPFFEIALVELDGSPDSPASLPLARPEGSLLQILVCRGRALLEEEGTGRRLPLAPGRPALLPASGPGRIGLLAGSAATLAVVGIPGPGLLLEGAPRVLP